MERTLSAQNLLGKERGPGRHVAPVIGLYSASLMGASGIFGAGWLADLACVALHAVLTVRFAPQHCATVMRRRHDPDLHARAGRPACTVLLRCLR